MKLICVMVQSLDGKTTKSGNPHIWQWTSKEDQEHFTKTLEQAQCIIMGRKTYEAVKSSIKLTPGKLRVVVTNEPKKYEAEQIFGQLEFTNENPTDLVRKLEQQGYQRALLVGGSHINSLFFKEGLVNELWLTLEPKLFGKGNGLVSEDELNVNLELVSVEKLNLQGTLLLKYSVQK